PVALKVMAPGVSAQARARFVREAGSASRLDHPAIARVLGSGNSDHGPWIAMELVQGLSLSEHLRRFPITVDRALEIAERVARAMDHAHRRGVVHRDLKPGNVLIARDGAVKVVDFGLAKDLDANAVLTTDGMAIGTPGYMSPEQVAPKADAVGVAADVHAIGTILYELVTGTRPFRGATARDVFVAILSEAPEPLAARRPDVAFPSGLQEIISRALAKRPADRYLTAVALADDIAAVRRGQQPLNAREETRSNDPALALRWGDRIGPYELRFAIGVGSASVVFKAVAADGSAVAVKVLRPRDRERLRRFEREVRLLAHFTREGKGFIPLLGHGVAAGGTWLAMPFVAGGTLRDRLERGPLATERAVSVVLTVAKAMARAHEEGITHRDLKPENILFTEEGEPLVADLGLARPAQGGDMSDWTDSVTVSREGRFMGSAGYAAPEQLDDAHKAGPPADVFALGAILYECVSGIPAIQAPNAIVLAARLAKADHKPLGVVAPEAPPWLVHVVERALSGAESERYRDAGELARALELQEAGLPAPGAADLARKALARVKKMVRKPRGRAESGD
ncbi:MAG TPA: serine/threonine-protein kinase, partial [Planctomycetota bacterium]|nr:serine/threonine-protein kinase [Planctomycetota bacterium]